MQHRAIPASHLGAEAPSVVRELSEGAGPVVLTVDGEARAVLQDIADYERDQRALAILRLAAYGRKEQEEGAVLDPDEAFAALDAAVYGDDEAEPTT
jgi:prevent-host-death family protein